MHTNASRGHTLAPRIPVPLVSGRALGRGGVAVGVPREILVGRHCGRRQRRLQRETGVSNYTRAATSFPQRLSIIVLQSTTATSEQTRKRYHRCSSQTEATHGRRRFSHRHFMPRATTPEDCSRRRYSTPTCTTPLYFSCRPINCGILTLSDATLRWLTRQNPRRLRQQHCGESSRLHLRTTSWPVTLTQEHRR